MSDGFIIMQIGNEDLDNVCEQAIVPALKACGLDPKRVDKHNQGGLLKSEIIRFIEGSEIIVADLTNERPNCYLEIGYTMGIDKFRNLILTVRENHNTESPNYINGGPKIHFDLSGYDILFWHPSELDKFRSELAKRIRRRLTILTPTALIASSPWDEDWIKSHRDIAWPQLKATGKSGFMEARFALDQPKPSRTQKELDEAARTSTIETFGWPIGIYIVNSSETRPKPKVDGIVAEIVGNSRETYDYWSIRKNGDFFLLKTIFEDDRDAAKIFFDTRIVRVTETLLYCARLYNRLKIDPTTIVNVAIRHGGFKGRILGVANSRRMFFENVPTDEDEIETDIRTPISGLESNLVALVKQLTAPLFVLFNFYELRDEIYEEIVNGYVNGQVV